MNPHTAFDERLDSALDWQQRAVIEAMFEAERTQKPIQVVVTQELIDKHKAKAKAEANEPYRELIMAVESNFEGETRHQTALRYIQEAERYDGEEATLTNQSNQSKGGQVDG